MHKINVQKVLKSMQKRAKLPKKIHKKMKKPLKTKYRNQKIAQLWKICTDGITGNTVFSVSGVLSQLMGKLFYLPTLRLYPHFLPDCHHLASNFSRIIFVVPAFIKQNETKQCISNQLENSHMWPLTVGLSPLKFKGFTESTFGPQGILSWIKSLKCGNFF